MVDDDVDHCDDNDAFWNIALTQHDVVEKNNNNDSDSADDNNNDDNNNNNNNNDLRRSNVVSYRLPIMLSANLWHDYDDDDVHASTTTTSSTSITLQLSPLPCSQGIFSPLGAQAWYGSALLSTFLLQQIPYYYSPPLKQKVQQQEGGDGDRNNDNIICRRIQEHMAQFDNNNNNNKTITALEIGSGAVGLAGLSLACMLACMSVENQDESLFSREQQQRRQQHCVILTDHEPSIVQHLKRNVEANQKRLQQQLIGMTSIVESEKSTTKMTCLLPQIHVETLDWNDLAVQGSSHPLISLLEKKRAKDSGNDHDNCKVSDANDSTIVGEARQQQEQQQTCPNFNDNDDHTEALQLLIGSELVYTPETARACAQCIIFLLDRYPRLLVVIIQVVHRDGWSNVFLPLLRANEKIPNNLVIQEECIPVDCDIMARDLIPSGGTLDRFDFGACYIYRSDAV